MKNTAFIIKRLLIHQWKEEARSVMRYQNLAGGILFGVLIVILGLNMLAMGIFLNAILLKLKPGSDPAGIISGFLLYYFIADMFQRFLLQGIPSQKIEPYRLLSVRKSTLSHYLLVLSLFNVFNLLPLLVFIPFAFEAVAIPHSTVQALGWLGTIMFLMGCNSLLSMYFNKQLIANPRVVALSAAVILGFVASDYYHLFSLREVSAVLFGAVINHPVLVVIPALMFVLLYFVNYSFLREHSYSEDMQILRRKSGAVEDRFDFLDRFGAVGTYMALELRLLFRNKRPRATIYFSLTMMLSGLLLYGSRSIDNVPYPRPESKQEGEQQSSAASSSQRRVTFRVLTTGIPAGAYIYVTGSSSELGKWVPSKIPLERQPDSSWERTISLPPDSEVQYKFTLGSWSTQALTPDGQMPQNSLLRVMGDTTVTANVARWKTPGLDFMQEFMLVYFGLLMTGMLMISYGQFLLSWEGSYFDLLISRNINFEQYLSAKYVLMVAAGVVFYIFLLPFGYFGIHIIAVSTAVCIYNIGINSYTFFYMATFSRRRLDLHASIFTTQGKGAGQYLTVFPAFILPLIIYLPIGLWVSSEAGLMVLAGAGMTGMVFHQQIMSLILKRIQRKKYLIAAGCRQN